MQKHKGLVHLPQFMANLKALAPKSPVGLAEVSVTIASYASLTPLQVPYLRAISQ